MIDSPVRVDDFGVEGRGDRNGKVKMMKKCKHCKGTGTSSVLPVRINCPFCQGTGRPLLEKLIQATQAQSVANSRQMGITIIDLQRVPIKCVICDRTSEQPASAPTYGVARYEDEVVPDSYKG